MDEDTYINALGTARWLEEREVKAMSEAVCDGVAHALRGLRLV